MTVYSRGDIVLVGFVFSEAIGKKTSPCRRHQPVAVQRSRQEIIVAAIHERTQDAVSSADHLIAGVEGGRVLFPSLVTGIFRTIKQTIIDRKVGTMPKPEMQAIDLKLRQSLGL